MRSGTTKYKDAVRTAGHTHGHYTPVPKPGRWGLQDDGDCVFLKKYICCYINGPHKQYIQVDVFNYMFHFGLQGNPK